MLSSSQRRITSFRLASRAHGHRLVGYKLRSKRSLEAEFLIVAFGEEPTGQRLTEIAGRIKTFTEGKGPVDPSFRRITEILSSAERLVFLGFAFRRSNVALLFPPDPVHPSNPRTQRALRSNDPSGGAGGTSQNCVALHDTVRRVVPRLSVPSQRIERIG